MVLAGRRGPAVKRDWSHEMRLLVEIPCLLALAVVGLLLLPIVGPFCVWKREERSRRGGFYDHP